MTLRKPLAILLLAPLLAVSVPWCSGPCCPSGAREASSALAAPSCCEFPSGDCATTLVPGDTVRLATPMARPNAWTIASFPSWIAELGVGVLGTDAAPVTAAAAAPPPRPQLRI